jgi:gas vesicle protein
MAEYEDGPTIIIERHGSVAAFLWGGIIGAGVALLLAPRTGEETREELQRGARRLRDQAEDAVRGAQAAVAETVDDVRAEVTGRVDQARDAFDAGRQAAVESRARLEERVRHSGERVRAGVDAARDYPAASAPETPATGDERGA